MLQHSDATTLRQHQCCNTNDAVPIMQQHCCNNNDATTMMQQPCCTNNGATAYLSAGGSNKSAMFVMKFQQDGIRKLLGEVNPIVV